MGEEKHACIQDSSQAGSVGSTCISQPAHDEVRQNKTRHVKTRRGMSKQRRGMSKQDEVRQIKARHVETKIAVGMLQNKLLTGHTPHHVLVDTNTCILITGNN